jgi:murein DD-endopeptidase MepM/ murein hydrolase activator NlpD
MRSLFGLIAIVCLPLRNLEVTSGFGFRIHPLTGKYTFHDGVDLRGRQDTVFAIMDGYVNAACYEPKIGLNICIEHGTVSSIYGHLSQLFVMPREPVFAAQPIGITGATGEVAGEHLHFAIRYGHQYIDPIQFLYGLLIKKENEQEF